MLREPKATRRLPYGFTKYNANVDDSLAGIKSIQSRVPDAEFPPVPLFWDAENHTLEWYNDEGKIDYDGLSLQDGGPRLVGVLILLEGISGGNHQNHANLLLFDSRDKTVERFEPHGYSPGDYAEEDMDNSIRKFFSLDEEGWTYILPIPETCPIKRRRPGTVKKEMFPSAFQYFQGLEENKEGTDLGYCMSWSLLYMELRMLNPDLTRQEITARFLQHHPSLLDYIRQYSQNVLVQGKGKVIEVVGEDQCEISTRGGLDCPKPECANYCRKWIKTWLPALFDLVMTDTITYQLEDYKLTAIGLITSDKWGSAFAVKLLDGSIEHGTTNSSTFTESRKFGGAAYQLYITIAGSGDYSIGFILESDSPLDRVKGTAGFQELSFEDGTSNLEDGTVIQSTQPYAREIAEMLGVKNRIAIGWRLS